MHRDESQKLPIQLDGLFDGAAPRRHVVQWLEARRVLDPDYDTAATSFLHLTIRKQQLKNNGTDPRWYTFTEQWIFWKIGKKLGTTRVSLLTFIRIYICMSIYIYMYSLLMQIYIYMYMYHCHVWSVIYLWRGCFFYPLARGIHVLLTLHMANKD